MLSYSLTNQLVQARVEDLHRAARNDGRSRRLSGTAGEIDRSRAGAVTNCVTRAIVRLFDGGRPAGDDAAAIPGFE